MNTLMPFWWLDRPFGQIVFILTFLIAGLVIVNLFLLMIYQIRLIAEKKFKPVSRKKS